MTKRIFRSIWIVALSVFVASTAVFLCVLYQHFSNVQHSQLRMQTDLAAQGVMRAGLGYFEGLEEENYRITWIGSDGAVRYDSKSGSEGMENHMEREEIKKAFSSGTGESLRYSSTLLERQMYYARRLPDGTVLRLSIAQHTLLTLILGMLQPICIIVVAALILSLILAFQLSKAIVKPLNEVDLDHPLQNEGYPELSPLLGRIAEQQNQIRNQQDALQQKQKEFEAVTTGMTEGIVLLNSRQMILSINPAAMCFFDTDKSCLGKHLFSIHRSLEMQELLQTAENGSHAERVLEWNGRQYQLEANALFSDCLLTGTALLILDVTEKAQAEQLRREFTANVSHELKTPLHTISGSAELLANGLVREEDIPRFSGHIYMETQRMIRLVEDIIKLSHLDEGTGDLSWEPIDLYALAAQTIQSLHAQAQEAGISLELCGESVVLAAGVRQLLEGIIFNLCDNAVKYNHLGGSVTVTVTQEEDQAILRVADTGIGIPEEDQERIFERFYRVDKSHSKAIGGTGLGLSIVKHAAKLHRAVVSVESMRGSGTTVTVRFRIVP